MRHCKTFNDVYTVVLTPPPNTFISNFTLFTKPYLPKPEISSETKCNQSGWQNRKNYPGVKRQKQAKGTKTKGIPNAKQLKTMAAAALK